MAHSKEMRAGCPVSALREVMDKVSRPNCELLEAGVQLCKPYCNLSTVWRMRFSIISCGIGHAFIFRSRVCQKPLNGKLKDPPGLALAYSWLSSDVCTI